MRIYLLSCLVLLVSGCKLFDQPKTAMEITLHNRTGDNVGTANLTEVPDGVKMELSLEGVPPGFHGLHLHEKASCEQPDFISAGNHLNPNDKKHGLLHPDGAHFGDLPNIEADDDSKVKKEITIEDATLLDGKYSLTAQGGSSIVITSKPDDGMTQISGDAGERIICGEIKERKK